ncbi:helix-turn-helix domain-containing protein [Sphingopyxis sp.]|uniref:helix-turn-helix domain-containing protein n=1 Tax=Sphingopyxis sp. TaxID=1908224 RepID=UPI00345CD11F
MVIRGRCSRQRLRNTDDRPWTDSPILRDFVGMEDFNKELGKRIRRRRKEVGLSQEDLALLAGIDRSYVGGIERADRNVSFSILCRLCLALRCDVAALTLGIPPAQT